MALNFVQKLIQTGSQFFTHMFRSMTIGVRAIVLDGDGNILLVKHTYLSGWYLPGGGVDPGENVFQAVRREVKEEADTKFITEPQLFGVYQNSKSRPRDHVALFVCKEAVQEVPPKLPVHEIIEAKFFDIFKLPDECSTATKAHIKEWQNGPQKTYIW